MSPTLTTKCSGSAVTPVHSPSLSMTSRPDAEAPTKSVIRLMSSCWPARTLEAGSESDGGVVNEAKDAVSPRNELLKVAFVHPQMQGNRLQHVSANAFECLVQFV